MSAPARRWLSVLAIAAAVTIGAPSPSARAGDAPAAPSDRDRAIAALVESLNLRLKAKVEEAAILDRQGRHDEALAALRAVETIHREGMALVNRLTSPAAPPTAPVVRLVPVGPGRAPQPAKPAPRHATRSSLDASSAVAHLLRAQRDDGWFRTGPADGTSGDERDVHATALAVVALLDSLDDDLTPTRARDAAVRGLDALLAASDDTGAFGNGRDLEAHALATWAVAAGVARLPAAPFRAAAQGALEKAVAFALARRDARGLWNDGTGSTDDDWVLSAWMAIALHEVRELPRSFSRDVDLGVVLSRVRLGAHDAWMAGVGARRASARFARALLLDKEDPEASGLLPRDADDEVALLFGTTLRFGRDLDFDAWDDAVLAPSSRAQLRDGPLAGSWSPSGDAGTRRSTHGRTFATACRLLAALVPVVPYREPAGD